MLFLYNLGIRLYFVAVWFASFVNPKAKRWVTGRKNQAVIRYTGSLWFHFASLGEFEQGRPVLEAMRKQHPQKKIVVTFFSPSGYEVRKNTPLADAVYYLPLDTRQNAKNFISAINPEMAVFTKYEYWYFFFKELDGRKIPLYIISGIFRPGQVFFKWYGGLHRQMLRFVTYFFLQDEKSVSLLNSINLTNAAVSGDTRFDRVWENSQQPKDIPLINEFKNGHKLLVAGSTWPPDEKVLASLPGKFPGWKFIIAPHEIGQERVNGLTRSLSDYTPVSYSHIDPSSTSLTNNQVLIIDNIGMLSSLYQYADVAYIGGGFGAGIHNTLEAAAFGIPVIFGPGYDRFKEAHDLINRKAGFSIKDESGLNLILNQLTDNKDFYDHSCMEARDYVKFNTGATNIIISHIEP